MLKHSVVPSDFKVDIIKPVLKDKHGDTSSTEIYTGIILTPVMSKLFESVYTAVLAMALCLSVCPSQSAFY